MQEVTPEEISWGEMSRLASLCCFEEPRDPLPKGYPVVNCGRMARASAVRRLPAPRRCEHRPPLPGLMEEIRTTKRGTPDLHNSRRAGGRCRCRSSTDIKDGGIMTVSTS